MVSAKHFKKGVKIRIGIKRGLIIYLTILVLSATSMLYSSSYSMEPPEKDILILLSTFLMVVSLHPLFHLATGTFFGVRFTHVSLNGPFKIQPTIRTEYSTYLRLSKAQKSIFHLSGIIATFLAILSGYFAAILSEAATAELVLKIVLVVNIALEFSPPLLVKLGFENFKKSDFYRFWQVWKKG